MVKENEIGAYALQHRVLYLFVALKLELENMCASSSRQAFFSAFLHAAPQVPVLTPHRNTNTVVTNFLGLGLIHLIWPCNANRNELGDNMYG